MLNKTSMLLAVAAVAMSAGAANADYYHRNHHRHYGHHYGQNNPGAAVSILFGNIAFGYRDGYWDNGHQWHRWSQDRDYQDYRSHGSSYHDWNHDRDRDNGWQRR